MRSEENNKLTSMDLVLIFIIYIFFSKTNYISLLGTAINANDHALINKQTLISQNLLILSSKASLVMPQY